MRLSSYAEDFGSGTMLSSDIIQVDLPMGKLVLRFPVGAHQGRVGDPFEAEWLHLSGVRSFSPVGVRAAAAMGLTKAGETETTN
jgi:hypothetical protein